MPTTPCRRYTFAKTSYVPKSTRKYFRIVDFVLEYLAELQGESRKARLLQTSENSGDSHMVMEGSQQSFRKTFFVERNLRAPQHTFLSVYQLEPIKAEHHVVGFDVPPDYLGVGPEFLGLLRGERFGEVVEPGLEGVGENPLNVGMFSFQFGIINIPVLVHCVDVLTVGL